MPKNEIKHEVKSENVQNVHNVPTVPIVPKPSTETASATVSMPAMATPKLNVATEEKDKTIVSQSKQMLGMVDVINVYGEENAQLKKDINNCKNSSEKLQYVYRSQILLILLLAVLIVYAVYRRCSA